MKPSKGLFTVGRMLRMSLAVGALALPVASQAAIQIFNLTAANLVAMPNNCGAGSMYNCGVQDGFTWTDPNAGATINSVNFRFNVGVDCHGTGTVLTTRLNATVTASISAVSWCSCSLREQNYNLTLPASAYLAGAANNFMFTNPTTCLGSCPSTTLGGFYGIVTVDYTPGTGSGGTCNLAPIESKLDDGTRFTSDLERTAQTTTLVNSDTTVQNNVINNNNAQTTTIVNILNDGTRFTSDAERIALQNAIVTEINANETKIDRLEAKLDTETSFTDDSEFAVGLQAIAALEAKADEEGANTQYALQIQIEHALGEDNNVNKPMVLYMLPAVPDGGHLEEVRDLVLLRIQQAQNNGCSTGGAMTDWNNGVIQYGLSHWDSAYAAFASAYRTSSMGPCN